MADLDLRQERRDLLVSELRAALEAEVPGSRTSLRGSLASGMADPYSDIDACWVVPDDKFVLAVESVSNAVRSAHPCCHCASTLTSHGRTGDAWCSSD